MPTAADAEPPAAPAAGGARPSQLRRGCLVISVLTYGVLLVASTLVRIASGGEALPRPERMTITVPESDGDRRTGRDIVVAYREWLPADPGSDAVPSDAAASDSLRGTVLVLHGSPGSADAFWSFGPSLARRGYRVVAPDLPGFGASTSNIADYSVRAHAHEMLALLSRLDVGRADVVGFSMGGGVALEMWDLEPGAVRSMVLLSSIGVQELELLGNYHLNHFVHGAQHVAIWIAQNLLPHFGTLDAVGLDRSYTRNFVDTDQRPLRGVLGRFEPPMLILHGREDFLVPVEAALEHHRLVPQSELVLRDDSHFFVFRREGGRESANVVADFLDRVSEGDAERRGEASADRAHRAAEPFDPREVPPWTGPAVLAVVFLLAVATFASEDLTCLGAGLLVAQGRIDFPPAVLGCFIGIVIGDVGLFWLGRLLGRPALRLRPIRWWISEAALEEASAWLRRRGAVVIALSRFLPGARLPTYVSAGLLRTRFVRFLLYFLVAAAIWTPGVVWLAAEFGERALARLGHLQNAVLITALLLVALMLVVRHVALPLFVEDERRKLAARLRRVWNWEFWPTWALYAPLLPWLCWLALRHRSLTLFTAANPALPAGGVIGESKDEIYRLLSPSGTAPAWRRIGAGADAAEALRTLDRFCQDEEVDFPLVLKPDSGERGRDVAIVESATEVERYFERPRAATLLQQYVPGREYGIFWYRIPGSSERGRIFGITEKRTPHLEGDGCRSLKQLVADDRRASILYPTYLRELQQAGESPERVPASGERVALVRVGAHARGTIFLDGSHLATPELAAEIERVSAAVGGFDFGRYDVKVPDEATLRAGGPMRVIELNGVTSEATHLYDPRHGLLEAWRILGRQWRLAFLVGDRRRKMGHRPVGPLELLRLVWGERRKRRAAERIQR